MTIVNSVQLIHCCHASFLGGQIRDLGYKTLITITKSSRKSAVRISPRSAESIVLNWRF